MAKKLNSTRQITTRILNQRRRCSRKSLVDQKTYSRISRLSKSSPRNSSPRTRVKKPIKRRRKRISTSPVVKLASSTLWHKPRSLSISTQDNLRNWLTKPRLKESKATTAQPTSTKTGLTKKRATWLHSSPEIESSPFDCQNHYLRIHARRN